METLRLHTVTARIIKLNDQSCRIQLPNETIAFSFHTWQKLASMVTWFSQDHIIRLVQLNLVTGITNTWFLFFIRRTLCLYHPISRFKEIKARKMQMIKAANWKGQSERTNCSATLVKWRTIPPSLGKHFFFFESQFRNYL